MFSFSCRILQPNTFSVRFSPTTCVAVPVAAFLASVAAPAGQAISFRFFGPFLAGNYIFGSSRNDDFSPLRYSPAAAEIAAFPRHSSMMIHRVGRLIEEGKGWWWFDPARQVMHGSW